MSKLSRSCLSYGVAIVATAIALLLTLGLEPWMNRTIGAFFYGAVMVSAWYGGVRAGTVAIVLSIAALNYYFISPFRHVSTTAPDDFLRLSLFTLVALMINLLTANLQEGKRKVEQLSQSQLQLELAERQQTEVALRQSEARLRLAQVSSRSGVWDWDVQTNEVFWSPEYYQLYGLDPSVTPSFERWLACIHPEDRERVQQTTLAALQDHELRVEFRVPREETMQWFAAIGQVLRDRRQRPTRMIGIAIDITQQKQAEIRLQQFNLELEERVVERTLELTLVNDRMLAGLMEQKRTQMLLLEQTQLLDLAHDTIMTLDLNSVITFWNQGAERMYGWSKAAALGRHSHTLLQTEFTQPVAEIQAILLDQGYWEGELIHIRQDGTPLTVASRWVLQTDLAGQPIKILEINNDITARKQVEQALRQYTAEIEDLYHNAPCGYHSLDAEGTVVRMNDTELNWLGYSRDQVLFKLKFVELLTPSSQPIFNQVFPQFRRQGVIENLELQMLRQDGTTLWVILNATALRDSAGHLITTRSTVFDITERRKVDQMKRDFISVVSHELRTPLTSIRGSLGLVAGGIYDRKPEKMREMIAIAARQSDRLVRLVNDILGLRRLESGQVPLNFKACVAQDLIQQSVDVMRSQAEANQINLVIHPTPVRAWADADTIVQTLTNLISNAIKFSPPNSTITLAAMPSPYHCRQVPYTLFSVQDQGRGIPAEHLETIFGQFQQVDASDSREKGGTGLGLAICRTIVEQHNGKIWATSGLEQGSIFYFTLPATRIAQATEFALPGSA